MRFCTGRFVSTYKECTATVLNSRKESEMLFKVLAAAIFIMLVITSGIIDAYRRT